MARTVFVVTGFELGWDCVVGVFDRDEVGLKKLRECFPEEDYYVTERTVETDISCYE